MTARSRCACLAGMALAAAAGPPVSAAAPLPEACTSDYGTPGYRASPGRLCFPATLRGDDGAVKLERRASEGAKLRGKIRVSYFYYPPSTIPLKVTCANGGRRSVLDGRPIRGTDLVAVAPDGRLPNRFALHGSFRKDGYRVTVTSRLRLKGPGAVAIESYTATARGTKAICTATVRNAELRKNEFEAPCRRTAKRFLIAGHCWPAEVRDVDTDPPFPRGGTARFFAITPGSDAPGLTIGMTFELYGSFPLTCVTAGARPVVIDTRRTIGELEKTVFFARFKPGSTFGTFVRQVNGANTYRYVEGKLDPRGFVAIDRYVYTTYTAQGACSVEARGIQLIVPERRAGPGDA